MLRRGGLIAVRSPARPDTHRRDRVRIIPDTPSIRRPEFQHAPCAFHVTDTQPPVSAYIARTRPLSYAKSCLPKSHVSPFHIAHCPGCDRSTQFTAERKHASLGKHLCLTVEPCRKWGALQVAKAKQRSVGRSRAEPPDARAEAFRGRAEFVHAFGAPQAAMLPLIFT